MIGTVLWEGRLDGRLSWMIPDSASHQRLGISGMGIGRRVAALLGDEGVALVATLRATPRDKSREGVGHGDSAHFHGRA